MPGSNQKIDPSEMLDLGDINLRLSENIDIQNNLREKLAITQQLEE